MGTVDNEAFQKNPGDNLLKAAGFDLCEEV